MNTQNITINGRNFQATAVAGSIALIETLPNGTRTNNKLGFIAKRGTEWVDHRGIKCTDPVLIEVLEIAKKKLW